MALPENTTYKPDAFGLTSKVVRGVTDAAKEFSSMLPSTESLSKKVDTKALSSLVDSVKSASRDGGQPSWVSGGYSAAPHASGLRTSSNVALGTVTTPFSGSTRYEGNHPGIDIANAKGTSIPSYTGGVVIETSTGHVQGDPNGFGNYVMIRDDDGNYLRYSHLNNVFYKTGQEVNAGDVVGTMGNSGSTYSLHGGDGTHLDLRIKNRYGQYIDPTPFIESQQNYEQRT